MTFAITPADVVTLNVVLTDAASTVLDHTKLHSALARPMHTYAGQPLFATATDQAAALLDGLVSAHAFSDGNKRTAWITTKVFLRAAGIPLSKTAPDEIADFVEQIATHLHDHTDITKWIIRHRR